MNFRGDYFIFVIFLIIGKIISKELPEFEVCPNAPTNLETVHVTIYFNGCTFNDFWLFYRLCYWRDGFSDDDVSITLKVGADVMFEDGIWICTSNTFADCKCTFKFACLSELMDQKTLLDLYCCAVVEGNTLPGCITEFGMDQALADCMEGTSGCDPTQVAFDNAQEVLALGVDITEAAEPYIFFEEAYDTCTSNQGTNWWAKSICTMLTDEKANQLQNCTDAFEV